VEPVSSVVHLRPRPESPPSDGELIARALAGDERAQEQLFHRHAPGVMQMADRILRDPVEAEDVAQHTFEVAFRKLHQLSDVGALRAWLLQIAVRRCHRVFRWRKVAGFFGVRSASEPDTFVDQASNALDPEQRAELALLDLALARLPERERVAWILRHVEGLSLEECAHACSCSLATVKRRIATADAVVRAHVEDRDAG
jgi:RNA polymerase sigma-70 factor (ECF subfamily)